ncbi:MAG: YbhB/YbcL family Raf kinase inhibitor-like protein [Bacteroidota bacterium]
MNIVIILASLFQATLTITSPDFQEGKMIPEKFTCEGANISPALTITNIPKEAVSMVLIMDDPDAPNGGFDHWVVFNIEPGGNILENSVPGIPGVNGRGESNYTGPCPPTGEHHYHFKVYALDMMLNLKSGVSKKSVLDNIAGHVIASGEIIGLYSKKQYRK